MPTQLDAASIARLSLHDPANFGIQHSQTLHRLEILQHWDIPAGSKVLELGCGQGDCTAVLACAVGEQGEVVAVDPADLDYGVFSLSFYDHLFLSRFQSFLFQSHRESRDEARGMIRLIQCRIGSPYTLGEAQRHISQSELGQRITWMHQTPLEYLTSLPSPAGDLDKAFDVTVLAHCLWYFSSPSLIQATFRALRQHTKHLLLAEWSLIATHPSAQPHVLAALTQAALECRKPVSKSNVRTVLAPKRLTELALATGWQLERETLVQANEGLLDGQWEVSACLSGAFEREVEEYVSDERERGVVLASRDACEVSLESVHGGRKGVRAMDVWVARFS